MRLSHIIATTLMGIGFSATAHAELADFLKDMQGSKNVKTVGMSGPSTAPFWRYRKEFLGYRFFSEEAPADMMATAQKARDAFNRQCAQEGGTLQAEDSPATKTSSVMLSAPAILISRTPENGGHSPPYAPIPKSKILGVWSQ